MKPFGASGCEIMFSSLLVSSKKFFSEFRSPDSIKYILGINIIYYVSFFIVAFFEIEWPKKQLFVVTNKQLAIIISIVLKSVLFGKKKNYNIFLQMIYFD